MTITIHDFDVEEHMIWLLQTDIYNLQDIRGWKQQLRFGYGFVAYLHQDIAGISIMSKGELYWLFVFEQYRGQGIGSTLLNHIIPKTMEPIYLHVECDNEEAIRLYQKNGFQFEEENGEKKIYNNIPASGCVSYRMFYEPT